MKTISDRFNYRIIYSGRVYNKVYSKVEKISKSTRIKYLMKVKIYNKKYMGASIKKLFSKINLMQISKDDLFYYNIDMLKTIYEKNRKISNLTVDYSKVLENSLEDYKELIQKNKIYKNFYNNEIDVIDGINILIDKITKKLENMGCNKNILKNIKNIKNKKTDSFYEALQRILFFNQLLWQTNHNLNGLGRLDMILIPYYRKDIENNVINEEEARNLIKNFILTLHKFYEFKSSSLLGDTGQIIELGGKNDQSSN